MQKFISILIFALLSFSNAKALDMNVFENQLDKVVDVNMWGSIVQGDDQKFRSLILPYVRAGNIVQTVNIFTPGGSVQAAMGIGDQIRTLEAKTSTASLTRACLKVPCGAPGTYVERVDCWFAGNQGPVYGQSWCNCASACFLIWASGIRRIGNHIGVHRFRFDEVFFGSLPPMEARALYTQEEAKYKAYLSKLEIPESIVNRMFATDSGSIYYLNEAELDVLQTTPYLEEYTSARCRGLDNPSQPICWDQVMEDFMHEGAKTYLQKYGN
jgi:hypothetical protein